MMASNCPILPACQSSTPKSCASGECIMVNQTCQSSVCNEVSCPDGTCVAASNLCAPFNGCPVNTIQCPDGECENNDNFCMCSTGGYLCYDGSCSNNPLSCPQVPSLIKPVPFTQEVSPTQASVINIPSVGGQSIATLNIPAGALNAGSSSAVAIQVSPVADSTIRNTTDPSWPPGTDSTTNIYSPVIQFSAPQSSNQLLVSANLTIVVNPPSSVTQDQMCLGFINNLQEWECLDSNLFFSKNGTTTSATGPVDSLQTYGVLFKGNNSPTLSIASVLTQISPLITIISYVLVF